MLGSTCSMCGMRYVCDVPCELVIAVHDANSALSDREGENIICPGKSMANRRRLILFSAAQAARQHFPCR